MASAVCDGYVKGILSPQPHAASQIDAMARALDWIGRNLGKHGKLGLYLRDAQPDWLTMAENQKQYDKILRHILICLKVSVSLLLAFAIGPAVVYVYAIARGQAISSLFDTVTLPDIGRTLMFASGAVGGIGVGSGIGDTIGDARRITLADRARSIDARDGLLRFGPAVTGLLSVLLALLVNGTRPGLIAPLAEGACVGMAMKGLLSLGGGSAVEPESQLRPDIEVRTAAAFAGQIIAMCMLVGFVGGALLLGLVIGVPIAQSVGSGVGIDLGLHAGLIGAGIGALTIGAVIGVDRALLHGGADALQHHVLEHEFAKANEVAPSLLENLNVATRTGLMCREGTGYTFVVRSRVLRDYFAEHYRRTHDESLGSIGTST